MPKNTIFKYQASFNLLKCLNFESKKNLHDQSLYEKDYKKSISDPEAFWKSKEDLVEWYEKPKSIFDRKNTIKNHWLLSHSKSQ